VQIYGPKKDEVRGDWRRLHIEEHFDLYCAINIIWVMILRRKRWAGHVARIVLTVRGGEGPEGKKTPKTSS
jgi:hypothetical protein